MTLRSWVEALCGDACAGRATASRQGAAARELIVAALRDAGLTPVLQPVPVSGGVNVFARAGGGARRVVLVGAHYDHLGGRYLGADDNAAAVAVVLELAAALRAAPVNGADVLLVAFDGEEPPHFMTDGMGSIVFARDPPLPLADVALAIIMDLVGHAIGPDAAPHPVRSSLFVLGAETSEGTAALVNAAARGEAAVTVRRVGIDIIPPLSDYEAFRRAGVPFVFLTCGRWRHYHETTDTPDRLDYAKLAGVSRFVQHLTRAAAARPRPRVDPGARDHAGTVVTLLDLARALGASAAVSRLQAIQSRVVAGKLGMNDWSQVLQLLAVLEQGLA